MSTPLRCHIPAELESAVDFVLPLITKFRGLVCTDDKKNFELEIRLGRRNAQTNRWESEVTPQFFASTLEMLQNFTGWTEVVHAADSHDYFYLVDGRKVRTSIDLSSAPSTITHMEKQPIGHLDVHVHEQACDARLSVKAEVPLDAAELPKIVDPILVRIKRRWSFSLEHWRFDLTQVWSGATRLDAEKRQSSNQGTHEVEIEFVGSPSYTLALTDNYLAASALMKVCSVLTGCVVRMSPLPPVPTYREYK
jgi:hypothetical protein